MDRQDQLRGRAMTMGAPPQPSPQQMPVGRPPALSLAASGSPHTAQSMGLNNLVVKGGSGKQASSAPKKPSRFSGFRR